MKSEKKKGRDFFPFCLKYRALVSSDKNLFSYILSLLILCFVFHISLQEEFTQEEKFSMRTLINNF